MVIVVVVVNGILALGLLAVAWKLWQLRQRLVWARLTLTQAEVQLRQTLQEAPEALMQGQWGLFQVRSLYTQQLIPQLQQVQRAMAIISLGNSLWRRVRRSRKGRRG